MRIILLLCLLVLPAQAWFEEVHELIAEIAWLDLRPEVCRRVEAILATHPDPSARTLAGASAWPDKVKKENRQDTFPWHFVNLPYSPDGTPTRPPREPNLLTVFPELTRDLTAENLAYLSHLVGDAHQPLHAVNAYTREFPNGDSGGGKVKLANGMNLHQYWDSVGGLEIPADRSVLAHQLRAAFPRDSFLELSRPHLAAWLLESHEAAIRVAYAHPGQREPTRAAGLRRVVLAGYRLADLLNRTLDSK